MKHAYILVNTHVHNSIIDDVKFEYNSSKKQL